MKYSVPAFCQGQQNQKELSDIDDKEFNDLFVPKQANGLLKAVRFFCFMFLLGPIRIVLAILFLIIYCSIVSLLTLTRKFFPDFETFRTFVYKVTKPVLRFVLLMIGIGRIKINGKLDPKARTIVSNHLSLIDGAVFFYVNPICFVTMLSLKAILFVRKFGECFGLIYVDRSKKNGGVTGEIIKVQNDNKSFPVQIFPEGKITNGDCLLGFRTGAFVNDTPIQPATIRYNQYFSTPEMATVAWIEDDFKAYLYHLFSIPLITVEINYLDSIDFKGSNKTPQERAKEVELMMANSLGVKAIKRNNKEIFQKEKQE